MKNPQKKLYILIACEESQAETRAFRERGHEAYSCDLQPCKRGGVPAWHIQGDVTELLQGRTDFETADGAKHNVPGWNLIIAHPPCTYMCKVGSQHMYKNPTGVIQLNGKSTPINMARYANMLAARRFFYKCLTAKADFVAVENPLPMKMAGLPQPSCYACPSWFGSKYRKKTLYWTRNLPPLMPTYENPTAKSYVRSSRGKYRSRTMPELAEAIAEQWGDYITLQM